jgi:hypothetical protein
MMNCLPRAQALVVAIGLAAILVPAVAAASVSSSYSVTGVEIAATSTEGTFVGTAVGAAGDDAVWEASVVHQVLTPSCYLSTGGCLITGGTFSLVNEQLETITGDFASGSITLISQAPGCGVQVFSVLGNLTDVSTPTTTGGTGIFAVTLTHFRARHRGHCITFFAKVRGDVSF